LSHESHLTGRKSGRGWNLIQLASASWLAYGIRSYPICCTLPHCSAVPSVEIPWLYFSGYCFPLH